MSWTVYIVRCRDNCLYTGITKDLARRIKEHSSGRGCRFTKYRTPVKLVYHQKVATRSLALKRESVIKSLPRKKKLELIKAGR